MPKPTLVDVGREAGVSAITVSRALRTPDKVSDSLRKKVEDAVKKLNYVPNQSASTLASSQTNTIVVVIPSVTNNVFVRVLEGIEKALENSKFTVQFGNSRYDPEEEERVVRAFLNPPPAGVILTGLEQSKNTISLLTNQNVPVVQIMDVDGEPINRLIGFSHEEAAATATRHLLESGYKKIGLLGAQMDPRSQKRFAGFKRELNESGCFHEDCVETSNQPSSVELGSLLMSKLVSRYPECDAVFCINDDLALGVLFECQRRGIRVPEDFGICGFNDLGITSQTVPTITSVSTPLSEIGRLAGESFLGNEGNSTEKYINLGYEVIARKSTARKR